MLARFHYLSIFVILSVCTPALWAQNSKTLSFDGRNLRAPMLLPKGTSTVQICGLENGMVYQVSVVPMAFGQVATLELAPASALTKGQSKFAFTRDGLNGIHFAAPDECVALQFKAQDLSQEAEIPVYITVMEKNESATGRSIQAAGDNQSVISVEGGFTAEQLVEDVLVGGGCFQISNVTFSGVPTQIGKFSNGLTNIGFDSGVIIATGGIEVALGPNDFDGLSQGFGIAGSDPDLSTISSGNIFDLATIEFDFVPTQNQVSFEFVFASEEYCEYVNSQFNDVFGFFISGPGIVGNQNLALIPNTNTPVTINTVNHLVNTNFYTHNQPIINPDCPFVQPASGPATQEIEYDGFTKKMVAVAQVIPCQKYHISLKIADVGDGVWDSAVFLRANSFSAGGEVLATPAYPGDLDAAYENCDAGLIRFVRANNDTSQDLEINFTVGGTATPGVDYAELISPVTIPAGSMELLIPIFVFDDQIPEGTEIIEVNLPTSCSCVQGQINFAIKDRPGLVASLESQSLCLGEIAVLSPTISGGVQGYTYLWNTGETDAQIQPLSSNTYTVEITDGCGATESVSAEVLFSNCSCNSETFVKTIGKSGESVRGFAVYDSGDGNLLITGMKQDSAAILKMSPQGTVLWTRTFDVKAGVNDRISELIVDSEGFLVGTGHSNDIQNNSGFIFRYNPMNNIIQWLNTFSVEAAQVYGLMELSNGNYLVYDNARVPSDDVRMLEFTRADGSIDPGSVLSKKLNLGSADQFSSAVQKDGKFYAVGRLTNGGGLVNARHSLSRVDLNTGNVDWTRLSHVAPGMPARLNGMDLILEDEHLFSVGYGSDVDDNLANSAIFLQKNTLNGNLLWVKKFNIPEAFSEAVDEIISMPDGFLIYARDRGLPSDLYLIKTDKDGELQWGKKMDYGTDDFVSAISHFQSQIMRKDDRLFFVASTQLDANSDVQMLVVKTNLDATLDGNCDFIQPIAVESEDVVNPSNLLAPLQQVNFTEVTEILAVDAENTALFIVEQCEASVLDSVNIVICPGGSVAIDGVIYTQDTLFTLTIPGIGTCDTLRTYQITVQPTISLNEQISFCAGGSVTIGGQVYEQSGTVLVTLPGVGTACDTVVTYTLTVLPTEIRSEDISFCAGGSVTIGGQVYEQSGTVIDTLPGMGTACDTVVTYTLMVLPTEIRSEDISFCAGGSVTIGGQVYEQSGTVIDTLPGVGTACDTVVTYTLTVLPTEIRSEDITFCAGGSVTIGGQVYEQSGTVIDTLPGMGTACDTVVTYTLTVLPLVTFNQTLSFCPGETLELGGMTYTQPEVVSLILPGMAGDCDTIATYTLQFSTPAPSNISITCPDAITVNAAGTGVVVDYNQPMAMSDCTCPGISLNLTSGLPSGSTFPDGASSVCYTAQDSCGQTASCCFTVTVGTEDPCDTKINGCIKYELLTITADMGGNKTYRVRVTNNCANKLIYTAIQVPSGLVAMSPANGAMYMAPSGNNYLVRSPNFSPAYSIRYSSVSDSLQNGESDIFKYTLPAQADVLFIHVVSRLAPYIYLEAHLNTFYCPVGVTPASGDRPEIPVRHEESAVLESPGQLHLFPNPTSGELFADFSAWEGTELQVRVLDSRGQMVQTKTLTAVYDAIRYDLPAALPSGLYFMELTTAEGERQTARFVVQR